MPAKLRTPAMAATSIGAEPKPWAGAKLTKAMMPMTPPGAALMPYAEDLLGIPRTNPSEGWDLLGDVISQLFANRQGHKK